MVLSKREQTIFVTATVAVAALALNYLAVAPYLDARSADQDRQTQLQTKIKQSREVLNTRNHLLPRWRRALDAGLKHDPAEAESQVLHAIRDWSEQAGVNLSLLRPERLTEKSHLPQIVFQASGTGTMRAVAEMLYRIETAPIPIKLVEMQVNSRKESTDDLSFQMRVSTIYSPPSAASQSAATGGGGL